MSGPVLPTMRVLMPDGSIKQVQVVGYQSDPERLRRGDQPAGVQEPILAAIPGHRIVRVLSVTADYMAVKN